MSTSPTNQHSGPARESAWLPLLLLLLTGLVHLASLRVPFVFDDLPTVVQSRSIERLWPLTEALSAPAGSNADGRPLVALSLAVNHALGGRDPLGYHLFNLGVHLLATLALYGVARRWMLALGRERPLARWGAFALCLVWTVHPLHGAVLDQVAYRNEAMMGLAFFSCLYLTLRGFAAEGSARTRWFTAAVMACWLGAGCKEVIATLPVIVLLLDRQLHGGWSGLRQRRWLYAGLAMTWPLLAWIRSGTSRGASVGFDLEGLGWLDYLRTQAGVVVHYVRLSLWPDPLLIDYESWPIARSFGDVWWQALVLAAWIAVAGWLAFRGRVLGVLALGSLVVLSPTSSFIPLGGAIVGEHRVYVPLAAWIAALGAALVRGLPSAAGARPALLAVAAALLALPLAWRGHLRHERAADPVELWAEHVEALPRNARAWTSYGAALRAAGREAEAEEAALRALELSPRDAKALVNLGNLELERGEHAAARERFQVAVDLEPGNASARYGLGSSQALLGDPAGAIANLEAALGADLDPRLEVPATQSLAWLLATARSEELVDGPRALQLAAGLVESAGSRPRLLGTLGAALAACGRFEEAGTAARQAAAGARSRGNASLAGYYDTQATHYASGRRWVE